MKFAYLEKTDKYWKNVYQEKQDFIFHYNGLGEDTGKLLLFTIKYIPK